MDFNLSPDTIAMQQSTREVVDDLLLHEPRFQETNEVPPIVDETLMKMGYYGLTIPEEYGGTNVDKITSVTVQLELARMPPQFWPLIRSAVGPTPHALIRHGTPAQKDKWLPGIAAGTKRVCFALTEPGGGSDVNAMKTTAVRKGDKWILNGTKTFISNANKADIIVVFAKTDKSKGRDGVSAFIIEPSTKGFAISAPMKTMGWMVDGLFELSFDDCEIPAENLLGEEGRGFYYALEGLSEARVNVGCQALGGGDIALEHALRYAKERFTFGVPLASHQVIQHMLADMTMEQHIARLLLLEAAFGVQHDQDVRLKSAYVKVFCTETANRTADKALQVFGGAGYIKGMVVERVFRDLRVLRIYEGASEIQRNMIAKHILK
ncbi:acyl-CoA dehydrogenase family protein [Variovorax sp. J22P168]|uniref:acyl-CoA dehydrogenase family protein n=1 Tax=Variovorax jilinensis TaxID=3053513 RepID=UPI0025755DFA|nr:acyl-CoA dehydrogenase family protein [Variovorax sp. J22P168]MDM0015158.1 acyl-CoA dehydrogenase family protein [Variovorax sp. J22P168]